MSENTDISNTEMAYNVNVRWVIPQRVEFLTFVGRDIFAVAHDIYIIFFNFKTNSELVYVANSQETGDGVDVVAGHRTNTFAFTEKVNHGRIFIMNYPSFNIVAELRDMNVNRYKGLCMMECELVAGFSGFPNYVVTVWNWRTQHQLISIPTGVIRRKQIYMASRTHLLICQCWGNGLVVWEVGQVYKKNLMLRRAKEEVTGWEVSEPPLVDVAWSSEGQLYAIDPSAKLYSVLSDGIGMVTNLEWSENLKGRYKPCMCAFGCGFLIYGPDKMIRSLKKNETKWSVVWSFKPLDDVTNLVANATCDAAAATTQQGIIYKITGESEEKIDIKILTYKQRNITKIQLIAPEYKYVATVNDCGVICIYDIFTGNLLGVQYIEGNEVSFQASPTEPVLAVFGKRGGNYGLMVAAVDTDRGDVTLRRTSSYCLTHQVVSLVTFSLSGRELVAAAMAAGHIFIMKLSEQHQLSLVHYSELGRGLADCLLLRIGAYVRCLSLVLFSDKYTIGERIMCINAETGKDNKLAGKMQGPYSRLLPLATAGLLLAVPHLATQYHVLQLSADKGVTVAVKMFAVIETGHQLRQYSAFFNFGALLTFGYDGAVILRQPDAPEEYDLKLQVAHRYETGIRQAVVDAGNSCVLHLAGSRTVACTLLRQPHDPPQEPRHRPILADMLDRAPHTLAIIADTDKNYLDVQEEKKVAEEAMDYKRGRDEVTRSLGAVRGQLLLLLEDNLRQPPLHQLPLAEYNLHHEHRRDRLRQAEREREELRLETEARIRAQDKVTAWIKERCWDTMLTPRVKIYAIFSHYQVENFAELPSQRSSWPELERVVALKALEDERDYDVLRPWIEYTQPICSAEDASSSSLQCRRAASSQQAQAQAQWAHALAGSEVSRWLRATAALVPQPLTHSYLQTADALQLRQLNVQNMRICFNKMFDELMNQKKREVGLVEERNARLRFIIEELNKLSDLRGSFHHLTIEIKDPEWRQEEQPEKLIKVDPDECSIAPYISPSQVIVPPPELMPKDDFRERALQEMMDGVLEKLWHEEIKKPIPMPQCMLEKDPEHFNEDDLRLVFEYETKVQLRQEERDKYRKMLHAEYAKVAQLLNENVVKFNLKVKDMWLTKLQVDSTIGQENLILMRQRRINLDRIEMAEKLENIREDVVRLERSLEQVSCEQAVIAAQCEECSAALDALAARDRQLDRSFKNHFPDLSPIIVDQCYKFFKKRPKWSARGSTTAGALLELAGAVLAAVRGPHMPPDCLDYYRGVEQLDQISNMPPVMDEGLWATMCRLRRAKIENEIRTRALVAEMSFAESAGAGWSRAAAARRLMLSRRTALMADTRAAAELAARNRSLQLVLPAGQVEIVTTGHMEDFEDATLIPREDIEKINNVILKVGEMKLRMMRKQMEFRKGILSKEWEHAQMKMKLRHMEQELYSYQRLKIPKELQLYLKNKEQGYTDEQDYVRLEKETEGARRAVDSVLADQLRRLEDLQVKVSSVEAATAQLERSISALTVRVSERRLQHEPLQPIRRRRRARRRMELVVCRSGLVRAVQAQHSRLALLHTELELLRLRTYPTLAAFHTLC